jgi:SAM domain (Sterile alpha motif)
VTGDRAGGRAGESRPTSLIVSIFILFDENTNTLSSTLSKSSTHQLSNHQHSALSSSTRHYQRNHLKSAIDELHRKCHFEHIFQTVSPQVMSFSISASPTDIRNWLLSKSFSEEIVLYFVKWDGAAMLGLSESCLKEIVPGMEGRRLLALLNRARTLHCESAYLICNLTQLFSLLVAASSIMG